MSRFSRSSTLMAAGLVGAVLALGPARADAPRGAGLACAAATWMSDRHGCRPARAAYRRERAHRSIVAAARIPFVERELYAAARYTSLLILGVGY